MKKEKKIWITTQEEKRLMTKAREYGFEGKGMLSHFISLVANKPLIIVLGKKLNIECINE